MIRAFYWLFGVDSPELGVAYVLPGHKRKHHPSLPRGIISDWQPLKMVLKTGTFTDYLSSDLVCRLCSQKMRDTMEPFMNGHPGMQWLEVSVTHSGVSSKYFILHIFEIPDVLDRERSTFVRDGKSLVKPCLDSKKVTGLHVFRLRPFGTDFVVSDEVREALLKAKCNGLEFMQLSQNEEK